MSLWLVGFGPPATSPDAPAKAKLRSAEIPIPIKILRYSQRLLEKYDLNRDGKLDATEWSQMQGNPRLADFDRDGVITTRELANRVARYGIRRKIRLMPSLSEGRIVLPSLLNPTTGADSPGADDRTNPPQEVGDASGKERSAAASPAGQGPRRGTKFFVPRTRLPRGLPEWFTLRDADGDAQITMAEFAPKATESQIRDFALYDRNGDGVITAEECVRGPKRTGQGAEEPKGQEAAEEAGEATGGEHAGEASEEAAPTAPEAASEAAADKAAPPARVRKTRSKNSVKQPPKKATS